MIAGLIQRLRDGPYGNDLDVQVEVALFEVDEHYTAARANAAGTKVIYTKPDGTQATHWAPDWSRNRGEAIRALEQKVAK